MSYNLFIDDERFPPNDGKDWLIVRTSQEAISACKAKGFPNFISFDHDLGGEDTSMPFIFWMIDTTLNSIETEQIVLPFPKQYTVHSQNPVGAANIKSLMDSFIANIYE